VAIISSDFFLDSILPEIISPFFNIILSFAYKLAVTNNANSKNAQPVTLDLIMSHK